MRQVGALRRTVVLGSGLADSGFSALASFVVGAAAVAQLSDKPLAAYSLMFASWVVCQLIPAQAYHLPSRLDANRQAMTVVPSLGRDFLDSVPGLLAGAILLAALSTPILSFASPGDAIVCLVGAEMLLVSSAIQAHGRALLHVCGRHSEAAYASAVQFLSVGVFVLSVLHVPGITSYYSVGALLACLALSNAISLPVVRIGLRGLVVRNSPKLSWSVRSRYVIADGASQASGYLVLALTTLCLGATVTSHLEAARVFAQPVNVFVSGIITFLLPATIREIGGGRFRGTLVSMSLVSLAVGAVYSSALALASIANFGGMSARFGLASLRALVASIDQGAAGVGAVMQARGRAGSWAKVMVIVAMFPVVMCVPLGAVFGPVGVIFAQAAGVLLKFAAGLRLTLAKS